MRLRQFGSIVRDMPSRGFVVLVVAVLAALPALAYSDPPDPTWVAGIWDDDDFDNVVDADTNTMVGADPGPASVLQIDPSWSSLSPSGVSRSLGLRPLDWFEGRAPPAA